MTASSLQDDRQPRVARRPPAEAAKVSAIARDDDPSFSDGTGEDIVVLRPLQPDFIDMNGVIAVDQAQMARELGRQVLVDQEAWRHNRPAGRPREGLALA